MIYHYMTGERKFLIKCSDNIMIYHYMTGGRKCLIKYSDNIMINCAYMIKA